MLAYDGDCSAKLATKGKQECDDCVLYLTCKSLRIVLIIEC
jgi:hypothetical protein